MPHAVTLRSILHRATRSRRNDAPTDVGVHWAKASPNQKATSTKARRRQFTAAHQCQRHVLLLRFAADGCLLCVFLSRLISYRWKIARVLKRQKKSSLPLISFKVSENWNNLQTKTHTAELGIPFKTVLMFFYLFATMVHYGSVNWSSFCLWSARGT